MIVIVRIRYYVELDDDLAMSYRILQTLRARKLVNWTQKSDTSSELLDALSVRLAIFIHIIVKNVFTFFNCTIAVWLGDSQLFIDPKWISNHSIYNHFARTISEKEGKV